MKRSKCKLCEECHEKLCLALQELAGKAHALGSTVEYGSQWCKPHPPPHQPDYLKCWVLFSIFILAFSFPPWMPWIPYLRGGHRKWIDPGNLLLVKPYLGKLSPLFIRKTVVLGSLTEHREDTDPAIKYTFQPPSSPCWTMAGCQSRKDLTTPNLRRDNSTEPWAYSNTTNRC